MSTLPAELEARLVELETRLAFQEHTVAELSDALAAARLESERNADLLRRALEELKSSRASFLADAAEEPPPPHY
jgi:SlyX protein